MAKRGPKAEQPDPETQPDPEQPEQEPQLPGQEEPTEPADQPEQPQEPETGPLSRMQAAIRTTLDYDQITEVRLALQARREDLEKHGKKGRELGVYEQDADRRMRILNGDDTTFGLIRIFEREVVTEQRDVFFDRESPNGRRTAAEPEDETITFRTVDGRDVTCLRDSLWEHVPDLRALFTAGILPEQLKKEIQDQDFWDEIEDQEAAALATETGAVTEEPAGVGA